MTTLPTEGSKSDRAVSENIAVLLHRLGYKQQQLATAVGMSPPTFSRRMSGSQPWMLWEVQAVASFCGVTLEEITTGLPTLDEWEARDLRACRDSNPKPSDLEPHGLRLVWSVRESLTPNRLAVVPVAARLEAVV